jgi:hypothetical protein
MPIEHRNLEAGTRLVARHKGKEHRCEVVQTDDGLRFRADGQDYRSPSSAGKAVMDGVACNGWRFWSVEGTEPKPRASKPKAKAPKKAAGKQAPAKKTAKGKRGKAKAASAKSHDSYGCGACGATFGTMTEATEHALTHTQD